MLISVKLSRNSAFLGSDKVRMLFFPLINVKMPTIVCSLTFMSWKKIMLSRVEHEIFLKPRALVITIEHGYGFKYNIYIICFARKCNNDTPSELSTKSTSKKKKIQTMVLHTRTQGHRGTPTGMHLQRLFGLFCELC